jgi:hypothetical protein
MSQKPVIRLHFIQKFMRAGLTYYQACCVYSCILGILEEAFVNGNKVKFGKIGCLFPVRTRRRSVVMNFVCGPGLVVTRSKRLFHRNERTDYRFNFYREFIRKHQLR